MASKKLIIFSLLFFSVLTSIHAQEKELLHILNTELRNEVKHQFERRFFAGDTLMVLHPFAIDQQKNLSVTIRQFNTATNDWDTVRQEVKMDQIDNVGKDGLVLLQTQGEDVSITKQNGENKQEEKQHFFRTYIAGKPDNKKLGEQIIDAFNKAGYKVVMNENWMD